MRASLLASFLLLLYADIAIAASPPFGEWLKIEVESCQPVVFEAPADPERARVERYKHGETLRVMLIKGQVVDARNFTNDGGWIFRFPPPATEKIGTTFVGYSFAADQACPRVIPSQSAYVRLWSCDVGWRQGACIVPLPQVQLSKPGEIFNFVPVPLK